YAPSLYSFHPALPFLPLLRRQPPRPTLFPYTTLFRSDQRSGTDGDRVGAKGNGLGNVGACANTTGNDEFHLAVHIHFLQSFDGLDRKSTRLNSSHVSISYAVFCLKKKKSQSGIARTFQ